MIHDLTLIMPKANHMFHVLNVCWDCTHRYIIIVYIGKNVSLFFITSERHFTIHDFNYEQ